MTIALVPERQSASTCASRSLPVGFVYTRCEYFAARHSNGYDGIYLSLIISSISDLNRGDGYYSFKFGRFGGSLELAYRLAFAK